MSNIIVSTDGLLLSLDHGIQANYKKQKTNPLFKKSNKKKTTKVKKMACAPNTILIKNNTIASLYVTSAPLSIQPVILLPNQVFSLSKDKTAMIYIGTFGDLNSMDFFQYDVKNLLVKNISSKLNDYTISKTNDCIEILFSSINQQTPSIDGDFNLFLSQLTFDKLNEFMDNAKIIIVDPKTKTTFDANKIFAGRNQGFALSTEEQPMQFIWKALGTNLVQLLIDTINPSLAAVCTSKCTFKYQISDVKPTKFSNEISFLLSLVPPDQSFGILPFEQDRLFPGLDNALIIIKELSIKSKILLFEQNPNFNKICCSTGEPTVICSEKKCDFDCTLSKNEDICKCLQDLGDNKILFAAKNISNAANCLLVNCKLTNNDCDVTTCPAIKNQLDYNIDLGLFAQQIVPCGEDKTITIHTNKFPPSYILYIIGCLVLIIGIIIILSVKSISYWYLLLPILLAVILIGVGLGIQGFFLM